MLERRTPLKRTAMKRKPGSELKRTEMQRGKSEMKRTPLKARSDKRAAHMRDERVPLIKKLVADGVGCLIGPMLAEDGIYPGCTGRIDGMHERRKRSAAGSLVNPENLIPACNVCNGYVESEPELVRERFGSLLVVREGDPEWVALGARQDRMT